MANGIKTRPVRRMTQAERLVSREGRSQLSVQPDAVLDEALLALEWADQPVSGTPF